MYPYHGGRFGVELVVRISRNGSGKFGEDRLGRELDSQNDGASFEYSYIMRAPDWPLLR